MSSAPRQLGRGDLAVGPADDPDLPVVDEDDVVGQVAMREPGGMRPAQLRPHVGEHVVGDLVLREVGQAASVGQVLVG